jgi:phage-related protein
MAAIKPLIFWASSLNDLRAFPPQAKSEAGFQLDQVQHGRDPDDWKPMASVGAGVKEIRVRDEAGIFRVMTWQSSPTQSTCCTASRRK